jgi:pimeloyl-CoA synthetase
MYCTRPPVSRSFGVTFVQPGAKPVRFFRIAWRDRNVSASVTVQGFGARIALSDALALARKQERLISNS